MSYSKYNAKRTEYSGLSFPSKLECAMYAYLKMEESQGRLKDIERYPSVHFQRVCSAECHVVISTGIRYKPDAKAFDLELNETVWYEAKGVETMDWRKNKKLWAAGFGPGRLRIFKGSARKVYLAEEIVPK